MEILYQDDRVLVCLKPAGVLSTDEPGGLPELLRTELGDPAANLRTVHRLDRVVSGVMVLARTARAASDLSAQVRSGVFEKTYLAVCRGTTPARDRWEDFLLRDPARRLTYLAEEKVPGAKPAALELKTLAVSGEHSLVLVRLFSGRTHQIRAQFSGRGFPLAGDRKYGPEDGWASIGLWSHQIRFLHPRTGEAMLFSALPPDQGPWTLFRAELEALGRA